MYKRIKCFLWFIAPVVLMMHPAQIRAQTILEKSISIHAHNQPLGSLLKTIETKGSFHFSYNSNLINIDSLVTLHVDNLPIADILGNLLKNRFEIKEVNNFIILRYAPGRLVLVAEKTTLNANEYSVRGYVADEQTGKKLAGSEIYEWSLLQKTNSNNEGYFELTLKNDGKPIILTASKQFYKDTSVIFLNDVRVIATPGPDLSKYSVLNGITNHSGRYSLSSYFITKRVDQGNSLSKLRIEPASIPKTDARSIMSDRAINVLLPNTFGGYNAGTALKIGNGLRIWATVFNNTR